ncbi:uncharacterized protein LOC120111765 [Phoenix dactylifera]|uniref:Uncharacterized protein LOC120111765 n=1 Tax=Phoenix dactylifera TaxID=42345 RepID=A0A8B9AIH8_PHODC|nr:uncharacterized protein LOC120111765 [Phoenix dactylifera]
MTFSPLSPLSTHPLKNYSPSPLLPSTGRSKPLPLAALPLQPRESQLRPGSFAGSGSGSREGRCGGSGGRIRWYWLRIWRRTPLVWLRIFVRVLVDGELLEREDQGGEPLPQRFSFRFGR